MPTKSQDNSTFTDDREGPSERATIEYGSSIQEDSSLSLLLSTSNGNSSNNNNNNNNMNTHRLKSPTNYEFSEESTQAIYEEIEVQHQSMMMQSMREMPLVKIANNHNNYIRGGSLATNGNGNDNDIRNDNKSIIHNSMQTVKDVGKHHSKNENNNNQMRFNFNGGKSIDSSSQEQSVSTWFPVPTLTLFQSKASSTEKTKNFERIDSPSSAQSIPFDEGGGGAVGADGVVNNSSQSPYYPSRHNPPLPTIHSRKMKNPTQIESKNERLSRRRERPWNVNNVHQGGTSPTLGASPRYVNIQQDHQKESDYDAADGRRIHPQSTSSKAARNSPITNNNNNNTNFDNINNSFSSQKSQSLVSPSPRRRKKISTNPFGSYSSESQSNYHNNNSNDDDNDDVMNQTDSFYSIHSDQGFLSSPFLVAKPEQQYSKNPFDSFSSSAEFSQMQHQQMQRQQQQHHHQHIRPSRQSSKSPIRQRIVKPPLRTNESKIHSLLSCATSPNDPKWMEALQILSSSPNPKQLAKMKIPHAHDWTALHIAALSNPPLYLIYALLLVYPQAVKEVDSGGRLPIHLAAGSEASVGVLSILVRFYDDSVIIEDGRGLIPLHLALLRDAGEEMSTDVIRILLGQNLTNVKRHTATNGPTRKVKDGCMRRGDHLNFTLAEVKEGIFGDNPNAIHKKEKRKRELRMKSMDPNGGPSFSRGFAYDINQVDSSDGIPFKHEYLSSLWEEDENVMEVDIFGDAEMKETQNFSVEVHQCLRKLSRWSKKTNNSNRSDEEVEKENTVGRTLSPASIPTPNSRLPIHMAIKRNFQIVDSLQLSVSQQNDVLRILIHANPSSLMYRDQHGKTPIITCLEMVDESSLNQVNLEMVELLLGMSIPGFRVAPKWLEDVDIVKSQQQKTNDWYKNISECYTVYNPAMIPSIKTLPLHIAASKALSAPIIQTIYYCYTGAKYVQDESNKTPLHCALDTESQNRDLDLSVLSLLIDQKIVRLRDMQNNNLFDLLIENGKNGRIPSHVKNGFRAADLSTVDEIDAKVQLRKLFHHSISELVTSTDSYQTYHEILQKIRYLPPWLRKITFQSTIVQEVLLSRVASPLSFAFIVLNGFALMMLIIFFIGFLDYAIHENTRVPQGILAMLAITLIYLALNGLAYLAMTFRLNLGWNYCCLSLRSWITFFALVLIATLVRKWMNFDNNTQKLDVLHVNAAVAFVWAMVVGYLSRWCYGVNVLCIRMSKVSVS